MLASEFETVVILGANTCSWLCSLPALLLGLLPSLVCRKVWSLCCLVGEFFWDPARCGHHFLAGVLSFIFKVVIHRHLSLSCFSTKVLGIIKFPVWFSVNSLITEVFIVHLVCWYCFSHYYVMLSFYCGLVWFFDTWLMTYDDLKWWFILEKVPWAN